MTDTEKLVATLRHYAKSGERLPFPFDSQSFVMEMAADALERRPSDAERFLALDLQRRDT